MTALLVQISVQGELEQGPKFDRSRIIARA